MSREIISRKDVQIQREAEAREQLEKENRGERLRSVELAVSEDTVPANPPRLRAPDTYVQRLMKYIPAEVIAAYMTFAGILNASTEKNNATLHWLIFAITVIGTVGYLRKTGVTKASQLALSVLALVVWVYYLGGPFKVTPGWHNEVLAALMLPAYTFLVPLIEP